MTRRTQRRLYTFLLFAFAASMVLSMSRRERGRPERETRVAVVERVIDGDTFVLVGGERVRLIGVDTPELGRKDRAIQYFAEESRDFLKGLVEGQEVTLTSDWRGKDRYDRTLAYVYLEDTIFVNREIVSQGFGFVYTSYPFDYLEEFRQEQRRATEESRGLWGREITNEDLTTIAPSEADKHYGERVIVKGEIVDTRNTGKACFLNFSKNWRNDLTAVVFARTFHKFPEKPQQYYLGKQVSVVGEIEKYRGAPQIILNDATEIQVTE